MDLTYTGGNAYWDKDGGALSVDNSTPTDRVTWTAPESAGSVTITAVPTDPDEGDKTITFEVVEPSQPRVARKGNTDFKHHKGRPDIGMTCFYLLPPDDVCFYRVEILEEECNADDTGCYEAIPEKGHSPNQNPAPGVLNVVKDYGTLVGADDSAYSGDPGGAAPFEPGHRVWNISVKYHVVGTQSWKYFGNLVEQRITLADDFQTLTCQKGDYSTASARVIQVDSDDC